MREELKREMPPEEKLYRLQRAIPYILNLTFDDLDAVHEVKRQCEVEIRTYDKENTQKKRLQK